MVDDIFYLQQWFELPSGHATFGVYYRQSQDHTPLGEVHDSRVLCQAWVDRVIPALRGILADDVRCPLVRARHVFRDNGDNVLVTHELDVQPAVGLETGPSLPNNCAVLVTMQQTSFSARTVGKIFIPGIPEPRSDRNIMDAAYMQGPMSAFLTALSEPIDSISDGGEWVPQVRAYTTGYAAIKAWKDGGEIGPRPPFDWGAAMADVTQISIGPTITHQKRRGTKVRGIAA